MKITTKEVQQLIRGATIPVIGIGIGLFSGFVIQHKTSTKPTDGVLVAYTADPYVKNDGQFQLGYIGNRFSVTCSKNTKQCLLETEIEGKSDTKTFPYVEQEWFTPKKDNRPWHTLDIIQGLPSYNGNPELKLGTDPASNRRLVNVLAKNGWVAQN